MQATLQTPVRLDPGQRRNALIVASVIGLHALALWGLQSGLLRRAVEAVIPVEMLAQLTEPPRERAVPPPPAPKVRPVVKMPQQSMPPPVALLATPDAPPSVNAPTGVIAPQPAAVATPVAAMAAPAPAAAPPPAIVKVELPSSAADYLHNPKPPYPSTSKRLGEQGQVLLRVFIEADGSASRAEIKQSSGFDRLDQSALNTVLRWRYVPGKRAGVAEAMWFVVPVNFVLE